MNGSERLGGTTALVTGGSSGLGRATALALAAAGADVAVLARGSAELEQTAEEVRAHGVRGSAVVVDLADAEGVQRAVEQVRADLGPVRLLVNAAGTDVPGPVTELDVAGWDHVLDVNLRASFLLARAVWPDLSAQGGGTIVNVSSVAGRRGWANASAYCAAKFGLTGLTQALSAEGRPHRIRACVLYPGAMDTSWGVWSPEDRQNGAEPNVPADALAPDQVARLIAWIASAPPDVVLNEVTVTPLLEQGWP
ncbi:short-chain dehydrogenase [Modestobacter caceresii]|jgi:NAD(P)-dependent dehydrogenase (short-subunit alcohol dehydrogenase family)|uniref:Short-chain dehydrogenase n=1 Tax=Modestobacter caceresii TaxID=1522368 RepID=A0A098Y6C9_9ACTN|nr:SDR family oxidoreductase [Modestobacter caceresii]KGH45251.1 short-chain dehydrogenase [Modestobacter caceresii]